MCGIPAALATAPSWLGTASTVASIAGVGLQAFSAFQSSQSAKESYDYQSTVARNNAITAEYQAQDAIKRGQVAEEQQRRKTAMMKGSQTARLAANGLDISEGSALQILSDTDWMGEQDALTVRDNANREASGYRQQSQNYNSNSDLLAARSQAESPLMSAGSTLLNGAGTVADKWHKMSDSKPKGDTTKTTSGNKLWSTP